MSVKNYSDELRDTLNYMEMALSQEFPSPKISPEYLITAILDSKKCYAKEFLENCLMSSNIGELQKLFTSWLEENSKNNNNASKEYSQELIRIIDNAEEERSRLGATVTNTQHLLLSMLNPSLEFEKIREVFKDMGIDYDFVINKIVKLVNNEDKKQERANKKMTNNDGVIKSIPLKSDTNKIIITSSVENINKFTININDLVEKNLTDPLIGREKEIEQSIKILARRKKNNVILVGNGGCGKSSIVNGIADRIINGNVPEFLKNKEIVMLNPMALVSGTHFRGMFEERVKGLFDELKASTKYILFLDDIQNVLKNSSKEKDTDLSGWISDILVNGDVKVIATTTFKDYRNAIESNTQISRKFQKIIINPLNKKETLEILKGNKHLYEKFHKVSYSDDVLERTVNLAERYITDRCLPDSAIDILDLSGAYTCFINRDPQEILDIRKKLIEINNTKQELLLKGDFEGVEEMTQVENAYKSEIAEYEREMESNPNKSIIEITNDHILSSVSDMTSIPLNKLTVDDKAKLRKIEDTLKTHIVGQDEAISDVCRAIKRNRVGLGNKEKPSGVFLALGPSGCGKTLLAKKLAEELFGSEKNIVRFDMSEYSEKHSVSKLLGASAGYIGYDNGGQLTEAIKHKQHCVLLLDEIEKADNSIYNIFLQLFDEGRLTDNSGQEVNFKNVIVLMTSNIGAREAAEMGKGLGFGSNEEQNKESIIKKNLKKTFTPEFINRIDKIVYFNSLTDDNLKNIVKIELEHFGDRVRNLDFNYSYDDDVVDFIHNLCVKDKDLGARPIIRLIQEHIEDGITNLLLESEYSEGYEFHSKVEDRKVVSY